MTKFNTNLNRISEKNHLFIKIPIWTTVWKLDQIINNHHIKEGSLSVDWDESCKNWNITLAVITKRTAKKLILYFGDDWYYKD